MKEDAKVIRIALVLLIVLAGLITLTTFYIQTSKSTFYSEQIQQSLANTQHAIWQQYDALTTRNPSLLIDSTRQHILFIGDSMAEGLHIPLKEYAQFNGHQLTTIAKTSASILAWVGKGQNGRLRDTVLKLKPTYIIISLGSNELFTKSLEAYEQYVENMVAQLENQKFIWICPPNWKEDNGLTGLIEKVIGTNRFFASKKMQLPRAGDGIHPTYQGYFMWMDAIATWIMEDSQYKILLTKPSKESQVDDALSVRFAQ